ncbi:hypothetical protein [Zobellella sp. DQSA1]|uniref:hypothetical protein n=1 Tax=Zobellella sp. DQSA1 TaxID=3342386 RepID=UPI0035C25CB7
MATLSGPFQMNGRQRDTDDTLLLRRELGEWTHQDVATGQRLLSALHHWPLLAELEGLEPVRSVFRQQEKVAT